MVLIPAGSFTMGNCMFVSEGRSDELPVHTVYVSAFYMDQYLVTKVRWDGVNQWATNHGYNFDNIGFGKAANHPVQTINWLDAVKWCNARSEMEGLNPCYYTSANQVAVYRSGQVNLTNACVNWAANGYRLPTEAEWEKAARGGLSGHRFPWGDTISWSQANYYAYPSGHTYDVNPTEGINPVFFGVPYTSPVDYFAPNGYGLYDMAGNVSQWCWDTNGVPLLQLTAASNYNYLVQSSTNLIDWTPTALLVNSNGTVFFTDPTATNSRAKYYRALVP
jgi:formylglycine-generating enzyme required for sulfatase activity